MTYSVYSYGGGELIGHVMNALAILFKSDSLYCTSVLKLSLIIAGLWAAIRGIYGGSFGIFAKDWFLPFYLIMNVLLVPKTTLHIIDKINPQQQYTKVDHIPAGVAFVVSQASMISHVLIEALEKAIIPVDAHNYSNTGILFSARLAQKARDVRISDPVMRQNMKDFVHQCFTLPFVQTNMTPGRNAALKTTDILGMIADNPHHWLGSYWRGEGGETVFQYCKDGVVKAREVLNLELPRGITFLASSVFGGENENEAQMTQRLKRYFSDGWASLAQEQKTLHEALGQEMMMNAYREGMDDKREEFSIERLNPHLIALSSTRAKAQQNASSLISADMVAEFLPFAQSVMFCLVCLSFVFVAPLSLCLGGFKHLFLWVQLVIWVQSWPVFFALINGLSLVLLSSKTTALGADGGGLSLLTQNGLSDTAWTTYCWTQGFLVSVIPLSWAIVNNSSQGLANLSSSFLTQGENIAARLGSEAVDGNLNVDNQSLHNKTIASTQIAQQQLGPSFSFSERFDDGRVTSTRGTDGKTIFEEKGTQLLTNFTESHDQSASLRKESAEALAASHTSMKMAGTHAQEALNHLYDYGEGLIRKTGVSDAYGSSQTSGENEDFNKMRDIAKRVADSNGISEKSAWNALGLLAGVLGKGWGGGLPSIESSDSHTLDKVKSSGMVDQFSHHLQKAVQHINNHQGTYDHAASQDAAEKFQGSYHQMQTFLDQSQAQLARSKTYSETASLGEDTRVSSISNLNDDILDSLAQERFNGNKQAAFQFKIDHPEEFSTYGEAYKMQRHDAQRQKVESIHPISQKAVTATYRHDYAPSVSNMASNRSINVIKEKAHQNDLSSTFKEDVQKRAHTLATDVLSRHNHHDKEISSKKTLIHQGLDAQNKIFETEAAKTLIRRTIENTGQKIFSETSPIIKAVGSQSLSFNDEYRPSSYFSFPLRKN